MALRVENNERAVNELTRVFKDYMEMQNEFENFAEYREKILGLSARIPTRWSVLKKFFKDRYLSLKKILDF
tara:strand:+ start:835 stop:1047 length:213 start_codon:yes stop_codon:yes gene_type:complete